MSQATRSRVVIAGGSGFLGQSLATAIIEVVMFLQRNVANALLLSLITVVSFNASQAAGQEVTKRKTLDNEQTRMFAEGGLLYRLERAAWLATDIVTAKLPKKRSQFGGYFAYRDSGATTCIFFTTGDAPTVLGSVSFDSIDSNNGHKLDTAERPLSAHERDIFGIRTLAFGMLRTDTLFKYYKGVGVNVVPIIDKRGRRVYIMPSPPEGKVVFGNDYIIRFADDNTVTEKRALHQSLIEHSDIKTEGKSAAVAALHTHVTETGDLMTATDYCMLRLYQGFTTWENYYIIGAAKVNVWNCKNNSFMLVSKEMFEQIMKDKAEQK